RMQRIEPLERLHALDQPLGVIQAIDAHHQRPPSEAIHDVAYESGLHRPLGEMLKFLGVDADGKVSDPGLAASAGEDEVIVGCLEHMAARAARLCDKGTDLSYDVRVAL